MKDLLKNLKLNEGNISLGLGVTVMLVAGVMLFNYFRTANPTTNAQENISSASTEVTLTPAPTVSAGENKNENVIAAITPTLVPTIAPTAVPTMAPVVATIEAGSEYTVQKNDSLWKIAAKTYGSGENWKAIYEANKEKLGNNASVISEGTKINLPKKETIAQANPVVTEATQQVIAEHKVNPGDNLWTIVHNACGTGFVYPEIAKQNNIANPRIIQPGQLIKMTCPMRK